MLFAAIQTALEVQGDLLPSWLQLPPALDGGGHLALHANHSPSRCNLWWHHTPKDLQGKTLRGGGFNLSQICDNQSNHPSLTVENNSELSDLHSSRINRMIDIIVPTQRQITEMMPISTTPQFHTAGMIPAMSSIQVVSSNMAQKKSAFSSIFFYPIKIY
jgi:hypothetical protein